MHDIFISENAIGLYQHMLILDNNDNNNKNNNIISVFLECKSKMYVLLMSTDAVNCV